MGNLKAVMLFCMILLASFSNSLSKNSKGMQILCIQKENKLFFKLYNSSMFAFSFFYAPQTQPLELLIKDEAGKKITPDDTRKEFDKTPYCSYIYTLGPGDSLLLDKIDVNYASMRRKIQCGPLLFNALAPGLYTAVVRFKSTVKKCSNDKGELIPIKNPWTGTVESDPFNIIITEATF